MKPLPDKAKAILALDTPCNRNELCGFIGIVNLAALSRLRCLAVLLFLNFPFSFLSPFLMELPCSFKALHSFVG